MQTTCRQLFDTPVALLHCLQDLTCRYALGTNRLKLGYEPTIFGFETTMGTKRPDAFEDYFLFNVSAKFRVRSLRIFGIPYRCANLRPAGQTEPEMVFFRILRTVESTIFWSWFYIKP